MSRPDDGDYRAWQAERALDRMPDPSVSERIDAIRQRGRGL